MAENKEIPSQYDLNAKWDACLDLGVRRFVYSSATGAFAGLLLFRTNLIICKSLLVNIVSDNGGVGGSKQLLFLNPNQFCSILKMDMLPLNTKAKRVKGSPVTRWASIAFGAGVGIGSAYSDCSQKFDGSRVTSPSVAETPVAKE
ncbi:Protein of unknown function DUF543 [Cynara cardunculus var. scolymus]|uniref:MICOS complex subunit MIC10 n=1 Tax=Cynara cardunculus var. scolymus TaxID=59895 RepID=A0A103XWN1_CYNCS|nr:Protein of unknown function DUF543 [Cynara cardunculus var. scolymus]